MDSLTNYTTNDLFTKYFDLSHAIQQDKQDTKNRIGQMELLLNRIQREIEKRQFQERPMGMDES
jgi:hypothetical protein